MQVGGWLRGSSSLGGVRGTGGRWQSGERVPICPSTVEAGNLWTLSKDCPNEFCMEKNGDPWTPTSITQCVFSYSGSPELIGLIESW